LRLKFLKPSKVLLLNN